ncbi:unnamed protein product, partial [Amoebophrya sp. A25]
FILGLLAGSRAVGPLQSPRQKDYLPNPKRVPLETIEEEHVEGEADTQDEKE